MTNSYSKSVVMTIDNADILHLLVGASNSKFHHFKQPRLSAYTIAGIIINYSFIVLDIFQTVL